MHMHKYSMIEILMMLSVAIILGFSQVVWVDDAVQAESAVGSSQNLLKNADFEGEGSWGKYYEGYVVDTEVAHSGRKSIRVDATDAGKMYGAVQSIYPKEPIDVLVISGWSKAENATGGVDMNYSIYLDIYYQDGTALYGQVATFSPGTHDWEYAQKEVRLGNKPIKYIAVYLLFRYRTGRVWFDDIYVGVKAPSARLDMIATTREEAVSVDMSQIIRAGMEDGVVLGLDRNHGTWLDLQVRGRSVLDDRGRGYSPFSICDIAKGREFIPLRGPVTESSPGAMHQEASSEPLGLQVGIDYRTVPDKGYMEIHARVTDTTGTDRGLMLRFDVPVDAIGGNWWDDIQTSRRIQEGLRYEYTVPLKGFADLPEFRNQPELAIGRHDRNFLSAVSGKAGNPGICLAVPLDQPRIYRTEYDSVNRRFRITYDFALVPETKEPGTAEFTFFLYGFDPEWGMRGALAEYYRFWPEFFVKHIKQEGQWMAFTDLRQIDNVNEFCFQIQEGASDVAYDDKLGVYSFTYLPSGGKVANIPGYDPGKDPLPPLPKQVEAMEAAFRQETGEDGMFERCGVYDASGQLAISKTIAYGHILAQFNPDPDLPYGKWILENARVRIQSFKSRGMELDGFYYDGLTSGLNYRRDHFAYADFPPLFDPVANKPVLNNFFSSVEFAKAMALDLHEQGKYTMMNGALGASPFVAPYLDVLGAETGLGIPRAELNYIRTVAYQKPFVTLLKGDFARYTHEDIETFMKLCLAYGVFPGYFDWPTSGLGPGSRYWDHAEWYERDRNLHRKYLPLCKAVAGAGWEPITYAKADARGIFVERFGRFAEGNLFFTVMNENKGATGVELRIAAKDLGITSFNPGELIVFDAIHEKFLDPKPGPEGDMLLHIEIPGGDVALLQVAKKADFAAHWVGQVKESLARRRVMTDIDFDRLPEATYWRPLSHGCEMDTIEGNRCLKLRDQFGFLTRGVWQWVMLYQPRPAPITIRLKVKAQDIAGEAGEKFALRARLAYVDNFTTYETRVLPFETGSYDWKTVKMEITPSGPVRSMQLSLVMEGKKGTAWFDDVGVFSAHEPDRNFAVDGGFDHWYERASSEVREYMDEEFQKLEELVSGIEMADASRFSALLGQVLARADEIESWIKNKGLENPCRRELRELVDLKHQLSIVKRTNEA